MENIHIWPNPEDLAVETAAQARMVGAVEQVRFVVATVLCKTPEALAAKIMYIVVEVQSSQIVFFYKIAGGTAFRL